MTRTILIYGNCQGEMLEQIGRFLPGLREKVAFKVIPLHIVTRRDWETRYDDAYFADVSVLWNQVESGAPNEHRLALQSHVKPDWQVVNFPPLSLLCLWPFAGNDPRLPSTTGYTYPWPDSIAASLAGEDLPDDALFARYMQITAERMPDLERRLRMDVARWRTTDALADFPIADWVLENFRTRQIFYTSGHLTALPLARLMHELLDRTAILSDAERSRAKVETDFLLRCHRGQDLEVTALHPLVAERMGIEYYEPDARHRWHGHEWNFRDYILKYIRWEPFLD
jgi:hypothetical protein